MTMDIQEFIDTVLLMREAQKAYFKSRLQSDLIKCKELERKVDKALQGNIIIPHLEEMEGEPAEGIQMDLFEITDGEQDE